MTFNTLRDRLLLRLLSQPSRKALFQVVFYDIFREIYDYRDRGPNGRSEHVATGLIHIADLIDDSHDWTAELTVEDS